MEAFMSDARAELLDQITSLQGFCTCPVCVKQSSRLPELLDAVLAEARAKTLLPLIESAAIISGEALAPGVSLEEAEAWLEAKMEGAREAQRQTDAKLCDNLAENLLDESKQSDDVAGYALNCRCKAYGMREAAGAILKGGK